MTKSNTNHLLNRRMYDGMLFNRDHSYNWKSDVDQRSKLLRRDGYRVRVLNTPLEENRYTTYVRKKGTPQEEHKVRTENVIGRAYAKHHRRK